MARPFAVRTPRVSDHRRPTSWRPDQHGAPPDARRARARGSLTRIGLAVIFATIAAASLSVSASGQRPDDGDSFAFDGPGPADATVRLVIEPRRAEVYVDGYLAGTADQFDGLFEGVRLPPGSHAIELYLDGYRAVRQQVQLSPGITYKVRYTMEPLPAGEAAPPRPITPPPPPPGQPLREHHGPPDAAGRLSIRVQPADAQILIDGEPWVGSGGNALDVAVSPGRHRIVVRKEGYVTFSSTADVEPGVTLPLNVSLSRVDRQ